MTRSVGQVYMGRLSFDLEELLALAGMVNDWKEQTRDEHNVSHRADDFREITRKVYRNSYHGNVPNTGKPPITLRLTERTSELYDYGTHFNEDPWYQIAVLVGSSEISSAEYCLSSVQGDDLKTQTNAVKIKQLFLQAQIDYFSRFKPHDRAFNDEQEAQKKNEEKAYAKAKKILGEQK